MERATWSGRQPTRLVRKPPPPPSQPEPQRHHDGELLLIPCVGGPNRARLVRLPAPLEIPVGLQSVYVLDDAVADADEYRYIWVPERL